jgi:uncharacterized membrane protein
MILKGLRQPLSFLRFLSNIRRRTSPARRVTLLSTKSGLQVAISSSLGAHFDGPLILLPVSSWNLNFSLEALTSLFLEINLTLFEYIFLFKVEKERSL